MMGWIKDSWRKEDEYQNIIKLQRNFGIILLVLCTALLIGWMSSPSRITVYIPPDIQNGATMKIGTIPEPLIYSFVYEIWQELNYWSDEGSNNYKSNIETYSAYITPKFKSDLLEENDELKSAGQLQRIRHLQGISGAAYDPINVKKLSNDTWEVDLTVRLTEYKNNQPVKDVEILYPIKVTRTNVASSKNPYGLTLAGFVSLPQRTKTYI